MSETKTEKATPDVAAWDVIQAEFVASSGLSEGSTLPAPTLAEVAFGGRSNVGKSSMLNGLMQRKGLVRTSSTPGCTRAVNVFHAALRSGLELNFVDLPGYGFARRSKEERRLWGTILEKYLLERPTLRAVLVIVDARRGLEDDDLELIEFCAQPRPGNAPLKTMIVATKLDLLPKAKRKPALAAIKAAAKRPVLGFSAETHEGRVDVLRAIERAILGDVPKAESIA